VKFCSWFARFDGTGTPGPVSYRGTYDWSWRHGGLQRVTLAHRLLVLLPSVLHTICRDCLLVRCIRKDPQGYADRYRSEYRIRSSVAYTTVHYNCCTDGCSQIATYASVALYSLLGKYRAVFFTRQVSRCIPYWASGVSASVVGEKHAGRVRGCVYHRTHGDVEEPSHVLSILCCPSEKLSSQLSGFTSLFDLPTKNCSTS
jgi:hypothetical protein